MTPVEKLAADFKRWGRTATKRVQSMTRKHGVVFDVFSDSERG